MVQKAIVCEQCAVEQGIKEDLIILRSGSNRSRLDIVLHMGKTTHQAKSEVDCPH